MLLAPVLHPPSIRVFDDQTSFAFANPAAIVGPGAVVAGPGVDVSRLSRASAAVIGAHGEIGGFTVLAEWRATESGPRRTATSRSASAPSS